MARFSERLAAALLAAAFLGGCMMAPMGRAMVGMHGHGAASAGHGGHEAGAPAAGGDRRQGMHDNMDGMLVMCESMMGYGGKR